MTLINEDYKVAASTVENYTPLHSGKFLGKKRVLIQDIPDYIRVRKLIKLTNADRVARENNRDAEREAREQAKADEKDSRKSAATKLKTLGLSDNELQSMGFEPDELIISMDVQEKTKDYAAVPKSLLTLLLGGMALAAARKHKKKTVV